MPTIELGDRDTVSRLLPLRRLNAAPTVRASPAEGLVFEFSAFAGPLGAGTPRRATIAHEGQRPAVRAVLLLRIMDTGRRRPTVWEYLNMYTSPRSTPRQGAQQYEEVFALALPGNSRPIVHSMLSPWPFTAGDAIYDDLVGCVATAFAAAVERALGMTWGCVIGAIQVDCLVMGRGDGGLRLAMTLERVSCAGGRGGEKGSCTICFDELGEAAARMPCGHVYHWACIARWLRRSRVCPLCRYEIPERIGESIHGVSGDDE